MVSPTQLCWRYHNLPISQWDDVTHFDLNKQKWHRIFSALVIFCFSEGCPNLVHLNISWCNSIANEGLIALTQGCKRIEHFSCKGCQMVRNISMAWCKTAVFPVRLPVYQTMIFKSPRSGVTLCFQFVSAASAAASAAAKTFPSHVKTVWAKLIILVQRIYGSGEMYWMTFPWPWTKVTSVALISKNLLVCAIKWEPLIGSLQNVAPLLP